VGKVIWLFYPETLILLIPAFLLAIYAQYKVRSAYARYLQVPTQRRITAREAVEYILRSAGITNVQIESIRQPLGDHYDPRRRKLRLSAPDSASVAAVGVACP
jgi:Zn-dependent membrane protease YugP